jgi:type III pantothenate kinase
MDMVKRSNQKGMILAIDMGNTNIVIGCVDDEKIYFIERLSTDLKKTELEYAIGFKTVLELYHIDSEQIKGAIISSVVPQLVNIIKDAIEKIIGLTPMIVGPGLKSGLNLLMDQPKQVGCDLVVDAVAAIHEYGAPVIVVDIGTATTISVVDKNKNYIGGVILPGVKVSLDSLVSRTAQLPRISLEAPRKVVGKNTVDCMKSGIIYGNASCIDGVIDRIKQETGYTKENGCDAKVVATGGLAEVIVPNCRTDIILDNELLLKGLKLIYDKNVE